MALSLLQEELDINALGDLDIDTFEKFKEVITDPVEQKRAKHAVYENQRTIEAVSALKAGNIERFGELMNQSHISLRDDYAVSCEEIDILVDLAWQIPGVVGSRITGGGFGGCTVSIVKLTLSILSSILSDLHIKKRSDTKPNSTPLISEAVHRNWRLSKKEGIYPCYMNLSKNWYSTGLIPD